MGVASTTLGRMLIAGALAHGAALAAPPPAGSIVGPPAPPPAGIAGGGSATSMWLYAAVVLVIAGLVLLVVTLTAIMRRRKAVEATPPPIEEASIEPAAPVRRAERKAPPPTPAETFATSGQVAEAQRLFNLMGDAEELATRLSQQLAEQAERMQRLIRTAEDRIERLEELAVAQAPAAPLQVVPPIEEQISPPPARPPTSGRTVLPPIVTRPMRQAPVPVGQGVQRSASQPQSRAIAASTNGLDPLTAEVYRLADDGMAVVDIAKQLGQHTGKVELILALRQG